MKAFFLNADGTPDWEGYKSWITGVLVKSKTTSVAEAKLMAQNIVVHRMTNHSYPFAYSIAQLHHVNKLATGELTRRVGKLDVCNEVELELDADEELAELGPLGIGDEMCLLIEKFTAISQMLTPRLAGHLKLLVLHMQTGKALTAHHHEIMKELRRAVKEMSEEVRAGLFH